MRAIFRFLILWLTFAIPMQALAQSAPATLVADSIEFDRERLSASGNVEIFSEGRILRATRLTFLRAEDRLLVEGPLTLIDGDDSIIVADFASLSSDLRGSVLTGARLVLNEQLQIAATEVATGAGGRYTQLYQTVASSCEVCAANPVPLWRIRARRIIHDRDERQLYFEGARFDILGVPVAWLPLLRLPDPTLERGNGILTPRLISDGRLGTGLAVPYFITLGPSRDLTLTPFVTNQDTRSLGFRYRQAFDRGSVEINGAASQDNIRPDDLRGYVFADGSFVLPRDYRLVFALRAASDDDYLVDYDITDADRLESRAAITRIDRDDRFEAEITAFQTLRSNERAQYLPNPIITVERQRRVPQDIFGGKLVWTLQAHARERSADAVPPGLPANSARDVLRASAAADWRRTRIVGPGVVTTAMAGLDIDAYDVRQDPTFGDGTILRAVPYIGLEARLPLARDVDSVRQVIEPVAQLILSPSSLDRTPDEDSLTPEFDEGNLFSTQRFAGRDTRELGNRLNLGVSYTRFDPDGWQAGTTVGRVFRTEDLDQFRPGTGLDGIRSDWLVSASAEWRDRVQVQQRTLFDDTLTVSRSETILRWNGPRHGLETRYTYLEADAGSDRPATTSEWALNASREFARDWTARVNWRYDFVTDDASDAGLGLTYRSDCVTVDFDVERRFTSDATLEPVTRFGFGVELAGFGANDRRDRRRRCGL